MRPLMRITVNRRQRPWRTDVDEEVLERFVENIERLGITQKAATERLMRRFNAQDQDVQALWMQLLTPEREAALARIILREMARRK